MGLCCVAENVFPLPVNTQPMVVIMLDREREPRRSRLRQHERLIHRNDRHTPPKRRKILGEESPLVLTGYLHAAAIDEVAQRTVEWRAEPCQPERGLWSRL